MLLRGKNRPEREVHRTSPSFERLSCVSGLDPDNRSGRKLHLYVNRSISVERSCASTCRSFVTIPSGLCRLSAIPGSPFANHSGGSIQLGRLNGQHDLEGHDLRHFLRNRLRPEPVIRRANDGTWNFRLFLDQNSERWHTCQATIDQ